MVPVLILPFDPWPLDPHTALRFAGDFEYIEGVCRSGVRSVQFFLSWMDVQLSGGKISIQVVN